MTARIWSFCKREAVLCIAAVCAAVSICAVPPDREYLSYIDLRVLCLLFCLMAVVAGFQACGLFEALAWRLLSGIRQIRLVILLLVLLPFFCSMLITNDVALITFVPFAVLVLRFVQKPQYLIKTVVLQTVVANLGSMATPVGNPQNLFLYASYSLSAGTFFSAMLPLTLVSLAGLTLAAVCSSGSTSLPTVIAAPPRLRHPRLLSLFAILFALCLLSVFRILHYGLLILIVGGILLIFDRALLKRVDYCLLITFVCFFIFAGNIGRIPAIHHCLQALLEKSTLVSSVLASQIISNVPAAVLLSGFTTDWHGLLLGTNIGGLGTPIASLASLISLKLYGQSENSNPARYLLVFTLVNLAGLAVLLPLALLR